MKRLILFVIALSSCALSFAQDEKAVNDSIALGEVEVRGNRTITKDGAIRMFPSARQKEASTTAYSLLNKLALPKVKVDEVMHTISVPENMGNVQVRINDIIATKQDLLSLDIAAVMYVDYIDKPGVRYGEGVGFVINVVTKRATSGYALGADLTHTITAVNGSDNVFARFNSGKSEFGVDYTFGYSDWKDFRFIEYDDYLMTDNSVYQVERQDLDRRQKTQSHAMQLRYSYADAGRRVLQATLSGDLSRSPDCFIKRQVSSEKLDETVRIGTSDRSTSPSLDLYYMEKLTDRQTLTASIIGSYAKSSYDYLYDSGTPYAYDSDGKAWQLFAEGIYENRLNPFNLSAGVRYNQSYTSNVYGGDIASVTDIHRSDMYAFTQIKGKLKNLGYTLGTGVSRLYYSQGQQSYEYWTFRPQLSAQYPLAKWLTLSYNINVEQKAPRLEYLGDVVVRLNEMELQAGNSSLRPDRMTDQRLTLACQLPSFYGQIEAFYRHVHRSYMTQTERQTADDGSTMFVTSRSNQRRIDMFYVSGYTRIDLLRERLSLSFDGGFYRFFNYGNTYEHLYSAFNGSAQLTAYVGKLTLSASADNGWSFIEGEYKVKNTFSSYIAATYKLGDFDVSLYWQNCFQNEPTTHKAENLNRYAHKTMRLVNGDFGNMLTLNLTWRISKGRKYDSVKRKSNRIDHSTGTVKGGSEKEMY